MDSGFLGELKNEENLASEKALKNEIDNIIWRGGRVVEGGGLLNLKKKKNFSD